MLSIGQAAKYLGISRDTLRRWEKKGKISPQRSPTDRRYYTKEQLDESITKPKKQASKEENSPSVKVSKVPSGSLNLVFYSLFALLTAVVLAVAFKLLFA